jgi:hypothetical protein
MAAWAWGVKTLSRWSWRRWSAAGVLVVLTITGIAMMIEKRENERRENLQAREQRERDDAARRSREIEVLVEMRRANILAEKEASDRKSKAIMDGMREESDAAARRLHELDVIFKMREANRIAENAAQEQRLRDLFPPKDVMKEYREREMLEECGVPTTCTSGSSFGGGWG